MRLARMCMVVALGVVPGAARADLPVSREVLGQLEATLEHCGRINPGSANLYRQFAKMLTGDATDKELTEARESAEYRDAYDLASDQVGKLPKEEAKKACAEGLRSAAR
jgi:hypothetical protein